MCVRIDESTRRTSQHRESYFVRKLDSFNSLLAERLSTQPPILFITTTRKSMLIVEQCERTTETLNEKSMEIVRGGGEERGRGGASDGDTEKSQATRET